MPTLNRVRKGFYLDSVALMRVSQKVAALPGVETAALMIGTPSNKGVLEGAGLLAAEGREAEANDLVLAVRAADAGAAEAALREAETLLEAPVAARDAGSWRPRTLETALDALPGADLALISVPGAFAAREARKALRLGLHVMIFSDNVSVEDERALKAEARERGLLLMGPDCGTALVGGVPLAFANEVPRGEVGIVSASGTGLQEVSCLIARAGGGVSHGIGVGGRDLSEAVGGTMTLAAIDALDADPATGRIVLISKPPSPAVAERVLARAGRSAKPFTVCFLGAGGMALPPNARLAPTLRAAAEDALGRSLGPAPAEEEAARRAAAALDPERRWVRGLFSGGTLCAEAQVILCGADEPVRSNAPVPGARPLDGAGEEGGHVVLDLGADEYTVGRPHPMLEPSVRTGHLRRALAAPGAAVVLIDVVLGYGAHADPAGAVADALAGRPARGACVVASVCGTEGDPQPYADQVEKLEAAGVVVAASNARAAELALAICRRAPG